jgi:hypothetical protein
VQEEQEKKTLSNGHITDKKCDSEDLPFRKGHQALDDSVKAKQKLDTKECIHEVGAVCVVHTNNGVMIKMFKVLHDQNYVFDRGKNLHSFWGAWGHPVSPCIMLNMDA